MSSPSNDQGSNKISIDKISEAVWDYGKTVFLIFVSVCIGIITYQAVMISKSVRGLVVNTNEQVTQISKSVTKTSGSIRLMSDRFSRYVLGDAELRKQVKDALVNITGDVHTTMKNVDGLVTDTRATVRATNELVNSSNRLVVNLDINLNQKLLPEATQFIKNLDGRTALMIEGDIHGLLQGTQKNLDESFSAVNSLLNNPDLPLILKEVRVTLENGEKSTFYLAQILKSTSEVTDYYKQKLIHPTGWDRFKSWLNIAAYVGGEIVVPFLISNRVHTVTIED